MKNFQLDIATLEDRVEYILGSKLEMNVAGEL